MGDLSLFPCFALRPLDAWLQYGHYLGCCVCFYCWLLLRSSEFLQMLDLHIHIMHSKRCTPSIKRISGTGSLARPCIWLLLALIDMMTSPSVSKRIDFDRLGGNWVDGSPGTRFANNTNWTRHRCIGVEILKWRGRWLWCWWWWWESYEMENWR